ncbi:voltage-dependent calcium channel subunit alpha-2/delta-3 isoform X2 [Schistocerca piceifrons]|uniref:voltage-dependent calcium channel subunit alpha-2/delta-3 isoform X2 n=1 Tax=Schistocerca piceifrons TaxID=274613 RepID=UPI001F5EB886|nr:voltage-dependent calcium channel subunit alpha-2/delta-3 isoform X2 [Schistocerca piceifrons]
MCAGSVVAGALAAVVVAATLVGGSPDVINIEPHLFKSLADKLGAELWEVGSYVSRRQEIQDSYNKESGEVRAVDGEKLLEKIADNIRNMTESKISAIKRIMDTAENTAMAHQDDEVTEFPYYNAKNLSKPLKPNDTLPEGFRVLNLTQNKHFYNMEVNTSFSAVHVPTNVYDKAPDLLRAVKWSDKLDSIFISNYQMDPSLSWQYFGSSLGFMRLYPAVKWTPKPAELEVDLYDCRTRQWYIEAAASPKDIVILVDSSGSMTGVRREIARQVVTDILDTLGINDYVNVFNFSEHITEVVPCYSNHLVQATLHNIRELKRGMEELHTDKIANFSAVLMHAFELLQSYRESTSGAHCNQAIMLITDGAPYNYKDIFEMYNWHKQPDGEVQIPVRVFTYLIGREVADVREVNWMACANKGYYQHLSTLAEVREKVLMYIQVMARPLVLGRTVHPTVWTPVYADVTDPKTTDWLWEKRECRKQKEIFLASREYNSNKSEEHLRQYVESLKRVTDENADETSYQLMTSVAVPVYDRRENANLTEWTLINEAIWVQKIRETKIADLLGVAGTDVPIQEIKDLMLPHLLGVNAYAFMVTNNGHILTHPDHRPAFQGILKPNYNSVDMTEVELENTDREARDFSPKMLKLRENIINRKKGSEVLSVKYHYDDMKRASVDRRHYHYCPIENTPFSLVVAIPEKQKVLIAQKELRRAWSIGERVRKYFSGNNWKLHPNWAYCRYHYETEHTMSSPEEQFMHFLNRTQGKWQWLDKRTVTPPEHVASPNTPAGKTDKLAKDSYYCDRDLFQALVFDAIATESFQQNLSSLHKDDKGKQFQQRFGVTLAFVATRSGLTRWDDIVGPQDSSQPHFSEIHNHAIDEVWYKRAVEHHYENSKSFVYSVPFDAGEKNGSLVTASHAIFHSKDRLSAPAAVVGFQFQHSALSTLFRNITYSCLDVLPNCTRNRTCASDILECYLLDNNGYVVVSENHRDTGKFFGEVRHSVMNQLIEQNVFQSIHIFDYQAVCFRPKSTDNAASFRITPLTHFLKLLDWLIGNVVWLAAHTNLHLMWLQDDVAATAISGASSQPDPGDEEYRDEDNEEENIVSSEGGKTPEKQYEKWTIKRTRPQPCDMEVTLYKLNRSLPRISHSITSKCARPFDIQEVQLSNLVLVVVNSLCVTDDSTRISTMPVEVSYNTTLACYKEWHALHRRRPPFCINNHTQEKEVELCGDASHLWVSYVMLALSWAVAGFIS